MLRAKLTGENGREIFIFGLDAENVRRLQAGDPIFVDLREMGGDHSMVIVYGTTLHDAAAQVEKLTGINVPRPPMPGTQ